MYPTKQPLKPGPNIFNHPTGEARLKVLKMVHRKTGEQWHLMSVIEVMEPDMQDYKASDTHVGSKKHSSDYSLFVETASFVLSDAFYHDPQHHFSYTCNGYQNDLKFHGETYLHIPENKDRGLLVPETAICMGALTRVLPTRDGPTWVKTFVDDKDVVWNQIAKNNATLNQLSDLSVREFRVDLQTYKEHIGNIYIVWHHPVFRCFRDVSVPASDNVLIEVHRRIASSEPFTIELIEQNHNRDAVRAGKLVTFDGMQDTVKIPLPHKPDRHFIRVFDKDGMLIQDTNLTHLHLNLQMGVVEEEVHIVHKDQKTGEDVIDAVIPKVRTELSDRGKDRQNDEQNYFVTKDGERDYIQMALSKEFLFLDGDKENKDANVQKAREYVRAIIERTKTVCYICDDYFCSVDFEQYVPYVKEIGAKVRILNSEPDLSKDIVNDLVHSVCHYNKSVGRDDVECHCLEGKKSLLHDRFVIVDDDVWAIGCSFTQMGSRACCIYKIPQSPAAKIKETVEDWWQNHSKPLDVAAKELDGKESEKRETIKERCKTCSHKPECYGEDK